MKKNQTPEKFTQRWSPFFFKADSLLRFFIFTLTKPFIDKTPMYKPQTLLVCCYGLLAMSLFLTTNIQTGPNSKHPLIKGTNQSTR